MFLYWYMVFLFIITIGSLGAAFLKEDKHLPYHMLLKQYGKIRETKRMLKGYTV